MINGRDAGASASDGDVEVPEWLTKTVAESGLERIQKSIAQAETATSGEIVPMIVHRSINSGHVAMILFLGILLVVWTLVPFVAPFWPQIPVWGLELGAIVLAAFGAWTQKESDTWRRWLTPPVDQISDVNRRAQLEFYEAGIGGTHGKTGVLIFVSLLERRAVVLADRAISEKLPAETWDAIVQALISRTKSGDFVGGMCEAIETVGALLAQQFPIRPDDRNELPNQLVIKE